MKQIYTSANTSVNSSRLPKIYNLAKEKIEGKSVLDYGCGKYFDNYIDKVNAGLYGYDKYNRHDEIMLERNYDIVVCSNVLNVIAVLDERLRILKEMKRLAPTVLITVYEGDKSRIGKETKKDCYQLNRYAADYIGELMQVFGTDNVTWHNGYYECISKERMVA